LTLLSLPATDAYFRLDNCRHLGTCRRMRRVRYRGDGGKHQVTLIKVLAHVIYESIWAKCDVQQDLVKRAPQEKARQAFVRTCVLSVCVVSLLLVVDPAILKVESTF
jgi:hypothetical protein